MNELIWKKLAITWWKKVLFKCAVSKCQRFWEKKKKLEWKLSPNTMKGVHKMRKRLSRPVERTHTRKRSTVIVGQMVVVGFFVCLFLLLLLLFCFCLFVFLKEGCDKALATHHHLIHNPWEKMTQIKSSFGKGKRNSSFGQSPKGVIALFVLNEEHSAKEPIYIMCRHLLWFIDLL